MTEGYQASIVSKLSESSDDTHIEKTYDFYARDLSIAFSILRELTEKEGLTSSVLTMQKYPTLEHVQRKSRKKDKDGNAIMVDKVVEVANDARWVLSFDWKTRDPAEARCLSYDFYDDGWPCSIAFMLADDEEIPVIEDAELRLPSEDARRFEMTMVVPDEERAKRFEDALASMIGE